ncbi:hypothetical protein GGX14DRAFT_580190 [Mycena pura]|uniref:Uncharacterized protein n=1 Tax=Mycena pura TaxID=153505 RepID=A0AAD6UQD8_9AGAR|nr:hypothetical protein GGX14DRAFT_580190 [Mycena pura]
MPAALAVIRILDSEDIVRFSTIIIPVHLRPNPTFLFALSDAAALQMMQVTDFLTKFGISTVAINEDTPNCPVLWSAISEGKVSLHHGHLPRMARLLHDHKFVSRVSAVTVDECHNIYVVGSTANGRTPFRPSYGALPQLRIRLGTTTAWSFLSATVPAHSMAIGPNAIIIRVSINRPNLICARHVLIGTRGNLRNLDLIIPPNFHPPMRIPKLVVFHGNKAETATARQHVNSLLPKAFQNLGIVRHYHADMSPEYLEDVYASFADPDGMCLILHATAGAGEMIEPWVLEIDTSEMGMDANDPDRPLSDAALEEVGSLPQGKIGQVGYKRLSHPDYADRSSCRAPMLAQPPTTPTALTKKHPTKQERTGRASIHHATSP